MWPLELSSRLAASLNCFAAIAAFRYDPSSNWSSAAAQTSSIKSSRGPHGVHYLALPFPSSLGKSLVVETASKISVNAATQTPKYVYPDPDPEFARAETKKFQVELMKRLSKSKKTFGEDIDEVVRVCSEIFSNFLHKEYGGPGTLLVEPFTDMLLALKEKKLPGPPVAARAALLWAQNFVDRDWEIWTAQTTQINPSVSIYSY